jgi:hypothetical protein
METPKPSKPKVISKPLEYMPFSYAEFYKKETDKGHLLPPPIEMATITITAPVLPK